MTLDAKCILPPYSFWDTFDTLEELTLIFTAAPRRGPMYFYQNTLFTPKPRGVEDVRLPKLNKFVTTDVTGKLLVSLYSPNERKDYADVIFNRNLDRAFLTRWTTRRNMLSGTDDNGNSMKYINHYLNFFANNYWTLYY